MSGTTAAAVAMTCAFLTGSVPFGLLLGWLAGKDVRTQGSGNIGATNVWRVCGWPYGVAAFALDFAKGALPVWLAPKVLGPMPAWGLVAVGLMAVLGHCFSPWLRFKGGKGVATAAGATACLIPYAFVLAIATFVVLLAWKRYVSLGSLVAAAVLAAVTVAWRPGWSPETQPYGYFAVALAVLVWWTHRANIRRLLAGTENRIGRKKAAEPAAPSTEPPAN